MNICVKFSKRNGRMSSIENKDVVLVEGQVWQSAYSDDTNRFDIFNITTTQANFDLISPVVGTPESPIKISDSTATQTPGLINVYVENGSLKVAV